MSPPSLASRERGVALVMVVWFVAGMSMLVAGIVSHARVDSRMTQVHLGRAKAVAAGDGAILLAVVDRAKGYSSSAQGPLISESTYRLGETEVMVRLIPAVGLVDLNVAPKGVLEALFVYAGGLPKDEAQRVADNVIEWRNESPPGNSRRTLNRQRFYALEDALRVEGVTRSVLDGVRAYAVAGSWTRGAMDWSASPESIMGLLESLKPGQLDQVMGRRDNLTRTGEDAQRGRSSRRDDLSRVFRADALVNYGGRTWLRRRWLAPGSSENTNLPWRVVRTEPPRVIEG